MGVTTLGDSAQVTITPSLSISGGTLAWSVQGVDTGRVYVQVDGGAKQLVAEGPSGSQPLTWMNATSKYAFTLVPVHAGIEGPVVGSAGFQAYQYTLSPNNPVTVAQWWAGSPPPSGSPPGTTDPLSFLDSLPGGRYPWLVGGAIGVVMLLRRK